MRKIKVLHYGFSENKGGIESVVMSWLRNKPDNFQFDFLNDTGTTLAYEGEIKTAGGIIHNVTHRYKNPIKKIIELKKIVNEGNYDFVHINTMTLNEGSLIVLANKANNCVPIVHCHTIHNEAYPFKERLLQLETKTMLIGQKYLKLACSIEAGKYMFGENNFTVIENGINLDRFKYDDKAREEIRKKYNIKKEEKIIGHIGHVCVEKNYPFLFPSIAELIKREDNYKLMLIGNICNGESIKKLIEENNLSKKVINVGLVEDTSKYYSAMDVLYLPSLNEGLPLVTIEAQATGLPCVISKNVTRETKISDIVEYTDLDINKSVDNLIMMSNLKVDRNKIKIDDKFDIKKSSKKLFDFYLDNIKR